MIVCGLFQFLKLGLVVYIYNNPDWFENKENWDWLSDFDFYIDEHFGTIMTAIKTFLPSIFVFILGAFNLNR
jgi:hypothetical protein